MSQRPYNRLRVLSTQSIYNNKSKKKAPVTQCFFNLVKGM